MKLEEESDKVGLKLSIKETKIMASSPVISLQLDGKTMETVRGFIFWSSKITADGDCSHEIKRHLLLGRKVMTKNRQHIKKQRHDFANKDPSSQSYGFSSSHDGHESWTIKKAECWRIDAFELWSWRRVLRVSWTARRSNQPIIKEISPKYSLEGPVLKLKLQYFGHLIGRTDSFENILKLGKIEGRKRRGHQRMRRLDGITSFCTWVWVMSLGKVWWWTGKPDMLQSMGSQRVGQSSWTELNNTISWFTTFKDMASHLLLVLLSPLYLYSHLCLGLCYFCHSALLMFPQVLGIYLP